MPCLRGRVIEEIFPARGCIQVQQHIQELKDRKRRGQEAAIEHRSPLSRAWGYVKAQMGVIHRLQLKREEREQDVIKTLEDEDPTQAGQLKTAVAKADKTRNTKRLKRNSIAATFGLDGKKANDLVIPPMLDATGSDAEVEAEAEPQARRRASVLDANNVAQLKKTAHTVKQKMKGKGHGSKKQGGNTGVHNAYRNKLGSKIDQAKRDLASDSHRGLIRAPYVLYGVKYIDLVSLAPFAGAYESGNAENEPAKRGGRFLPSDGPTSVHSQVQGIYD